MALECCGHLSQFTIQGTRYSNLAPRPDDLNASGIHADHWTEDDAEHMCVAAGDAMPVGVVVSYEYDYGDITTGTNRPHTPPRLRQEPVPAGRPSLLPPLHHQGRGGRRRHHRGQGGAAVAPAAGSVRREAAHQEAQRPGMRQAESATEILNRRPLAGGTFSLFIYLS